MRQAVEGRTREQLSGQLVRLCKASDDCASSRIRKTEVRAAARSNVTNADGVHLAEGRYQWRALVDTVTNLWITRKGGGDF
jgi:hypothetical protein